MAPSNSSCVPPTTINDCSTSNAPAWLDSEVYQDPSALSKRDAVFRHQPLREEGKGQIVPGGPITLWLSPFHYPWTERLATKAKETVYGVRRDAANANQSFPEFAGVSGAHDDGFKVPNDAANSRAVPSDACLHSSESCEDTVWRGCVVRITHPCLSLNSHPPFPRLAPSQVNGRLGHNQIILYPTSEYLGHLGNRCRRSSANRDRF